MTSRHYVGDVRWEELHPDCLPWGARGRAAELAADAAHTVPASRWHRIAGVVRGWLAEPGTGTELDALADALYEQGAGARVPPALRGWFPFHRGNPFTPAAFAARVRGVEWYARHQREFDPPGAFGWVCVESPARAAPSAVHVWELPEHLRPDRRGRNEWVAGWAAHAIFPSEAAARAAADWRNRNRFALADALGSARRDDRRVRVLPCRGVPSAHLHPDLRGFCDAHPAPAPEEARCQPA
jgi:hypothetical protein